MTPKRLAIFLSGGGSTAHKVLEACRDGELRGLYTPVCVVSSKTDAGGIDKAREFLPENAIAVRTPPAAGRGGIDTTAKLLQLQAYNGAQHIYGQELVTFLRQHQAEVVAQLGWMPLTPDEVIEAFPGHMINQHPGPLDPGHPDFGGQGMYGKRVHAARLRFARECGRPDQLFTEATVQFVHRDFDRGPVFQTRRVEILPEDGVDSLAARLLPIEHDTVIRALVTLAHGEATPFERRERLVLPSELELLKDCKRSARPLYPHV